jgi:hypothetical protein
MIRLCGVFLLAATLSGCAAMTFIGETEADLLPSWAGGLPKNTPPRPGEAGYRKLVTQIEGRASASFGQAPAQATQATSPASR